ncbi:MAG: hypothetical protein LBO05_01090 [Deltaproteobacteria bacterium]|jgi:hypothetical protein|nr:hypothetical protein [Deltaproteobacteria bacterium]
MLPGTPEADASRGRDANRFLAMRNGVNLISPVAGGNSKKDEEAGAAGAVVLGVGDFIQPESAGREHLADLEPCPEETAEAAASSRLPNLSDLGFPRRLKRPKPSILADYRPLLHLVES